jgi:hypothetical protein
MGRQLPKHLPSLSIRYPEIPVREQTGRFLLRVLGRLLSIRGAVTAAAGIREPLTTADIHAPAKSD